MTQKLLRRLEVKPARIRTDNGAPFAGTGLLGLSKLSLSWMKRFREISALAEKRMLP